MLVITWDLVGNTELPPHPSSDPESAIFVFVYF